MKAHTDTISEWIDNNTGLYGKPLSYQERIEDCQRARGEQFQPKRKRFVYKFYYEQDDRWTSIGEHEVNDQEELWETAKKFEKKYKAAVRFDKVKSLW